MIQRLNQLRFRLQRQNHFPWRRQLLLELSHFLQRRQLLL